MLKWHRQRALRPQLCLDVSSVRILTALLLYRATIDTINTIDIKQCDHENNQNSHISIQKTKWAMRKLLSRLLGRAFTTTVVQRLTRTKANKKNVCCFSWPKTHTNKKSWRALVLGFTIYTCFRLKRNMHTCFWELPCF